MRAQYGHDGDGLAAPAVMAQRVDGYDWSTTPLGPRHAWPQSLRTIVDMMLSSGHAMCLAWGPDRTFLYNDTYAPFLGARHPAALGQPFRSVWPEVWDEIGPLVERTFAGETVAFRELPLVMTRHGFPEDTWWDFAYSPVRDDGGEVAGLLNVALEATARVVTERQRDAIQAELRERETFLRSVLAASTDCIKVVELDGSLSFMSEGGMQVMEVSDFNAIRGCPWPDFLKGGGVGLAREALETARAGGSSSFEAAADTYVGSPKFWSVSVSPIYGEEGRVARILSVSRDITELDKARQQQRLLNEELGHRLKNILAMVQSLTTQTLRQATSPAQASEAITARLASLAQATDVLTAASWQAADMLGIIEAGLLGVGAKRDRVEIAGPSVTLNAQAALALTLVLHELATNAVKYGALSNEAGTVALRWTAQDHSDGLALSLSWREQDGPPVSPPPRRGFGTRLIERSLQSDFRGKTALTYAPEGVRFDIDAVIAAASEPAAP